MSMVPYNAPRPQHTCTRHQPGSRTCHNRCLCRCRACTDQATRWQSHCVAGLTKRVPGTHILAHVTQLHASGMTTVSIATAAGVPDATLQHLVAGRSHSMNRATAAAILAVQPTTARRGYIASIGTARRLQGLATLGWDTAMLAPRLGVNRKRVGNLRAATTPLVHITVANRVDDLYRQLCMTPNTGWQADRARTIATQRGWVPPLAWDDGHGPHGIDNPDATPSAPAGTHEPTAERIAWLAEGGQSIATITTQLGITEAAVERACYRAGRTDLWDRLNTRKAA